MHVQAINIYRRVGDQMAQKKFLDSTGLEYTLQGISSQLNNKTNAAISTCKTYTDTKIAALINQAPETLDTLKEIADAINNHQGSFDNYVQNVAAALDKKSDKGHVHDVVTVTVHGFMSAEDKVKLNGIATGANKTIVDSALSDTSTNPVQNKVVTSAINHAQTDATDAKTTANANKEELTKTQQILNAIKTSYLKSVSVSGNTLTIKDQNDSEVKFYNTTYGIVSSSSNGLAPAIGTSVSSIIGNQGDEWVLTSTKGEAPTWRKLPVNAFLNNNDKSLNYVFILSFKFLYRFIIVVCL